MMHNLADLVLDYLWFVEFSDDDELDPDRAVKLLEDFGDKVEVWAADEKQALSDAAARRLKWLQTPDKYSNLPGGILTDDQKAFLQALVKGRFDGYLDFGAED